MSRQLSNTFNNRRVWGAVLDVHVENESVRTFVCVALSDKPTSVRLIIILQLLSSQSRPRLTALLSAGTDPVIWQLAFANFAARGLRTAPINQGWLNFSVICRMIALTPQWMVDRPLITVRHAAGRCFKLAALPYRYVSWHVWFGRHVRCTSDSTQIRLSAIGTHRQYISQKWKTGTGRQYFADIIGLSSTTVTQLASKAIKFAEKNAKYGLLRRSTSFKPQGHRGRYKSNACSMRLPISD